MRPTLYDFNMRDLNLLNASEPRPLGMWKDKHELFLLTLFAAEKKLFVTGCVGGISTYSVYAFILVRKL